MHENILLNYLTKLRNKQNKKLVYLLEFFNYNKYLKKNKKVEMTLAKELVVRMLIYIIKKKNA